MKFSPDGKLILISTNGQILRLIDAFQGTPLQTFMVKLETLQCALTTKGGDGKGWGWGNEYNSIGWLYTVMYLNVWRCNKWVKDLITFLINLLNNFHIWKTWRLHLQCVVLHYMLIYSGNSLILLHFKCGKSSRPSFTTYYFIVQVFTNILHCFVVNSVYL